MPTQWEDILAAYLHDPPDKAIGIPGHESWTSHYADEVLGYPVSASTLHSGSKTEDILASIAERFPMPPVKDGKGAVSPIEGCLTVKHPLTGGDRVLSGLELRKLDLIDTISELFRPEYTPREKYFALWRHWCDSLGEPYQSLPADTRVPDHTIWNHLDMVAGLTAARSVSGASWALLSFHIGPVQSFINAARSLRDLWTGSMLLSKLAFEAMVPILETLGPTALVYPALRGNPMLDCWLESKNIDLFTDTRVAKMSPCIPNRFLAIVPSGEQGENLAKACRESAIECWRSCAESVRVELDKHFKSLKCGENWDRLWQKQIDSFFEIRTSLLKSMSENEDIDQIARLYGADKWDSFDDDLKSLRQAGEAIGSSFDHRTLGLWQYMVDIAGRVMAVTRSDGHVPQYFPTGDVPPKCSLLGSYEQMGPSGLDDSAGFWKEAAEKTVLSGVRVRQNERFSAVALVKRFAGRTFLKNNLHLDADELQFSDTATVAASVWLKKAGIEPIDPDWSGQWLHWKSKNQDPDEKPVPGNLRNSIQDAKNDHGAPPAYYAILMMDGDNIGKWLRGKNAPILKDILHPEIVKIYETSTEGKKALKVQRPADPTLHASISEALSNFSLYVVPSIIEEHKGVLVYSGGDDVLALLPLDQVLACALKLRQAYSGDPSGNISTPIGYYHHNGRNLLMMGGNATASTGIAVVHYKEDIRFALKQARDAEKAAKNAGRNLFAIRTCKRSGEHLTAFCPWDFVETVGSWLKGFKDGASDRWVYHVREEVTTLHAVGEDAEKAELRRHLKRSEELVHKYFPPGEMDYIFDKYKTGLTNKKLPQDCPPFRLFIDLLQTTSFLARGRDS